MKARVFCDEGFVTKGTYIEREKSHLISKSNGRVSEELINCIRFQRVK